ncbi:MC114 [Molluscum contagiosum virus subtype 2]|uniref:MC114 n=2 Tax=Molluscum contagiosum virus TaxID=10279 RepID=A0A1S7DME7_MCV2|nr:MC114 [Molluscum contagiosum virus subtype 2]QHW16502.1 MC114R [Molluscum contagiosum virus]AYO87749.1 MC114 [Molluscum contagiosum virus subtype 2]AYO87919.1 MC114 [Molluscum contagiosum virus subtype 2]AYO88089.1 MC114 [Molluscum contagiosum virus subtype 2]
MTAIPVTDIANEYAVTTFSEDGYPCNKNYEITSGQMSILRSVHEKLLSRAAEAEAFEEDADSGCAPGDACECGAGACACGAGVCACACACGAGGGTGDSAGGASAPVSPGVPRVDILVSEAETVIERRAHERAGASLPTQTPSLSGVYDREQRMQLLEAEVAALRRRRAEQGSDNLANFTKLLFQKNPARAGSVNKRVVIVNYASMNQVPLALEDLEGVSDEEVDSMYRTIRQYHEVRKKKIVVTNFIIIVINVLEQLLLKLGFDDIKGLSSEVTSELIDVEIGDDCEQIATRLGISNNPALNITLFIVKLFIRRIRIL